MNRIFTSLRTNAVPSARAARGYATAPGAASSSNLAPILLGLGVVGAGGFYYSTRDTKQPILEQIKNGPPALSTEEFRNFKLIEISPYNHNTSRFTFALPEGTTSGLTVASCLVTKSATEGQGLTKEGKPAVRPYTPVSAPDTPGKIELLIKHYKGGAMTEHIFGLKKGDLLAMKGPNPKFPYKANEFEHIGCIAGGSGITPMWQIIQEIANNPQDKTKVSLVFGNVKEEDILLRKEFEGLAKKNPDQFKMHFVLDSPPSGWPEDRSGYISQKVLAQALPPPAYGERVKLFVCGPPPQVNAISGPKKSFKDQGELKGILADIGYTEKQVYKF